ncbi:hypothetical protein [Halothece sp. PCC 7418]|uniref:hypothetical protein n=1 Tax=Halothece sp. (strain PCC 7418) TaxID=65093 RepID=UPI0012372083|nr:hypothetical protein [Halothece sp. PCC 7418]
MVCPYRHLIQLLLKKQTLIINLIALPFSKTAIALPPLPNNSEALRLGLETYALLSLPHKQRSRSPLLHQTARLYGSVFDLRAFSTLLKQRSRLI